MNDSKYISLLLICFLSIQMILAADNTEKFNQFLSKSLHLENNELNVISKKLTPYFEQIPKFLMDDFLLLAQEVTLIPIAQQHFPVMGNSDARAVASQAHQLIFENEFLRILESSLKPGQIVPFHTHQWDSIILTVQGSKFRIDDGTNVVLEDWPPMAEQVEGSDHAYSYQNIGPTEFQALIFEFKK